MVFLAQGFEEVEAFTVVDYLRRKDIEVHMTSITGEKEVQGAHGIKVVADQNLEDIKDLEGYEAVIIPGGLPGATNLRDHKEVIKIVKAINEKGKLVGAICAGPIVLEKAGILKGKSVTSYPGFDKDLKNVVYKEDKVVKDGNIITSRGPALAVDFALAILEYLLGEEAANTLKEEILYQY